MILMGEGQLHACTGTQPLQRRESKVTAWKHITWTLHLSVDHDISVRNISYRSFYNANLVCLMVFAVMVGFVCPLGYLCSFVCFGLFWSVSVILAKTRRTECSQSLMAAIVPGPQEELCHVKKLLVAQCTDEKIHIQRE